MGGKSSDDFEVAEGVEDAVVVDGGGDVVGLLFEGVDGVAHGDADASGADHRGVVAAVAESDGKGGIETSVGGHGEETLTLVGLAGGDIGKFGMPASGGTVGDAGHECGFIVGSEKGRDLKDALLEHGFEGLGQMKVLDGQLLTEDAVDIALGIVDGHIELANDNQAVAAGHGIVGNETGRSSGNGVTGYRLGAHETEGAVGGDVAVDEVRDGTEVGNNDRRPARRNKHTMSVGLGLRQREDR